MLSIKEALRPAILDTIGWSQSILYDPMFPKIVQTIKLDELIMQLSLSLVHFDLCSLENGLWQEIIWN